MWYLLAITSVFGHWALSIWIVNRLHATALPYRFVKALDKVWYAFLFLVPLGVFAWLFYRPDHPLLVWERIAPYAATYGVICVLAAIYTIVVWARYLADLSTTERLLSNHDFIVDVAKELGHRPAGTTISVLMASLPYNQVFQLNVNEKTIVLPRLPRELDGLTVTHISDFHFTGRITRDFYETVVSCVNELKSDIVAITGDIVDKPRCLPWLNDVLGKIQSTHGIMFVLGNHDLRIRNEHAVRAAITKNGHHDLGGRWKMITVNDWPIFFGGNELPWFPRATNMSECPDSLDGKRPFRILLSHSPDQIPWARQNDFDLMLAGHTHGGQIRFPGIGPIFTPSRYGVKYASGTFYEPPTLMHVSRGLAGCRLVRFNCRPEMTQLILRCDEAT
jgi:predicted MPP superfamily phosphohydrolase